ncbi:MAG: zinc-ribbon domain-containing protein [Clostridia bacterium]|nr:zinc-ribbon domain-containing protein [Clostridia bacterium]
MPFCTKCGSEVSNEAKFCTSCGNTMSENTPATPENAKKLHCPNCKSHNLTVTTESSVGSAISTGRNVRTTVVSNTHRNYWVCSDCGMKFRNIQSLEEEIQKNRNNPIWATVFAIIAALIFLYLTSISNSFMGVMMTGYRIISLMITVICFIYIFVYKNRNKKMKEELEYLKKNCFN